MKGTSYLTVLLLVSLGMIWGLVLLLLAQLYCSPIIHRHRVRHVRTPNAATAVSSLVYISNPLYVDENGSQFDTTTESSNSQMEAWDYSGDDERE